MTPDISIILPTFNERENIANVVAALDAALPGVHWEAIFVDDDSPDGTAARVRMLARDDPRLRCIQRLDRRGLSSACIEGMLAASADIFCVMDADLQHDERLIPEMLRLIRDEGFGLVNASRYMAQGSAEGLSPVRLRLSRAATLLSRLACARKVSDPMSGFFALDRRTFELVMRRLSGRGFKILLDVLGAAGPELKMAELPYRMRERTAGESKLDANVVWEFFALTVYRTLGRLIPFRFILFATVGLSGVVVHMSVLFAMHRLLEADFVLSQLLATVTAMSSNFLLNNRYTFRERRLRGVAIIRGLLSFYLVCALGALINLALAEFLFERHFAWWVAGMAGVVAGSVWNFGASSILTWRAAPDRSGADV